MVLVSVLCGLHILGALDIILLAVLYSIFRKVIRPFSNASADRAGAGFPLELLI